jgi:Stage II sporulation protein M
MDASSYAFVHGMRHTRATLGAWQRRPAPVLLRWTAGAAVAAVGLLAAVWAVAYVDAGARQAIALQPPFAVGDISDVWAVLRSNLLVLALHAMACVAGFIAGSSLPLQVKGRTGRSRRLHEHGGRIAIGFVVCATAFSLSAQAFLIGHRLAGVAGFFKVSQWVLLVGVLPHAIPELIALFLPLAAWIIASRRGAWEELLAATLVTVAIALPVLVAAAYIEVYVSPHLFHALTGIDASSLHRPGAQLLRGTGARAEMCPADARSRKRVAVRLLRARGCPRRAASPRSARALRSPRLRSPAGRSQQEPCRTR